MRSFLPLLAVVLFGGCGLLTDGGRPDTLAVTNRADRPVVAAVFTPSRLALVDLADAIRAADFEQHKLDVGVTLRVPYDPAFASEGVVAILYARPDQPNPRIVETYGAGAAEVVGQITLSAQALRRAGHRVVIRNAR